MGFSLAWLAVRGLPVTEILDRLKVSATPESSGYVQAPLSMTPFGEWTLIVARGCDHRIVRDVTLSRLSSDCEVIACRIEEHVMYSSSSSWSQGQRRWLVEHDAGRGKDHCAVVGDAPAGLSAVMAQCVANQQADGGLGADVDHYFEIPLKLAEHLVGFKHDETNEATNGTFHVLADLAASSSGGPWWKFWQ